VRNAYLDCERIGIVAVELVRPENAASWGIDQLCGNANATVGPHDCTLDNFVGMEMRGDLTKGLIAALKAHGRNAANDTEGPRLAQLADNVVCYALGNEGITAGRRICER